MSPDMAKAAHHPHAKAAVWPWLLVPILALALFFALRSVRSIPGPSGSPTELPAIDGGQAEPAPPPAGSR